MWQLGAKTTQRKLCCCNTSRKVQISNNQWETYMISKKTSYTAKQTAHFPPYSFHAGLSSAKSVASASPCRQLFWWQAVTVHSESLGRLQQRLKRQTIVSNGFIFTVIKASKNTDREGNKTAQHNQRFSKQSCLSKHQQEHTSDNFSKKWEERYCQRQCLSVKRKEQLTWPCALMPCALIRGEGRGDLARSHSLSRNGATWKDDYKECQP